jgi:phospholipase C
MGMFLEKRFGITVPNVSPWHRAVCGDLTAAFDFTKPGDAQMDDPGKNPAPTYYTAQNDRSYIGTISMD